MINKKFIYVALFIVAACVAGCFFWKKNSCKDLDCRVKVKCRGHLIPRSDTLNILKAGNTIAFVEYERDGVARHEFEYYKQLNPDFFKGIEEESFRNEGEAGGMLATVVIYKALKPGDSEITLYKKVATDQQQDSVSTVTAPVVVATYKFHIE